MPVARDHDLVTTRNNDELLVYDLESNQMHYLNPATAAVWQRCDGESAIEDLPSDLDMPATTDAVRLALTQLSDAGLLETPVAKPVRVSRQSRRRLLRRSAAVAIPAIVSITAPAAAQAQSCSQCVSHDACDVHVGECCYFKNNVGQCQGICYRNEEAWGCS